MIKNFDQIIIKIIKKSLEDDKVLNLKIINIKKKKTFADYVVIASGTSQRHIVTMAKNLKESIKKKLNFTPSIEGSDNKEWVLIDANIAIVNIFKPEIRKFYNLEKIWDN